MSHSPDKLQAFLGKAVGDLGAAVSAALMSVTKLPAVTSIMMPSPAPISSTTNRRYVWPIPRDRSICRAPIWWSKISSMSFTAPLRIFAPAKAWNGASIINACFMGRSDSSALAIMPIC